MAVLQPIPSPTLIGHPFNPIGTGRALRVTLAALWAVGVRPRVRDIWEFQTPEPSQARDILPLRTSEFGAINIFHINGMEIQKTLERLGPLPSGHNIIQPFWELPRYPSDWTSDVELFDEIWAPSRFVFDAISAAVDRPVHHMSLPVEVDIDQFLSRRYFGISEASFAFLFMFDLKSYIARKNPQALIRCFRQLIATRPWSAITLVVKVQGIDAAEGDARAFVESLEDLGSRVVVIDRMMTDAEVAGLIACCDAFVSLHRSEGFGLSLAEAMYLGIPTIATAWSGNLDFMTSETAELIDYKLVPVPLDAYPHAEHQVWAEPDIDQATERMTAFVDDPAAARALGQRGSRHIRAHACYRAGGLRYLKRLGIISQERLECSTAVVSIDHAPRPHVRLR